ncbi:MAG: FAD/NAD(P)-binding oxidoreductase [Desulfobacterales bacterium]|jgi:sulfide:quinone oxidoreductase|nr:FAD/NAD(P)-binding oxidoreductase [Desulfobacterales bacterium]MDP6807758.1 FAD/NAD(P)-binding oxidoreductase [Desulfobacterales bacterium]|tara:strand:- start:13503 stop:14723 length:1221 start_codon:yes stop_codon:yes gene_type:complete
MTGKTILVLGGGVGGIVTANQLRRKLGAQHRIIVVEDHGEYVFTPSLLWVMVGWRQPQQITKDRRRLLRPDVELVAAEAQEIDLDGTRVRSSNGDLNYDYLVVALGADHSPAAMPGFSEAAHTPFNLEGASGLWSALQEFEGGRVAVLVSGVPYKCPAAPYEIALLLDDHLRQRGIREKCELQVYTPEPLPMGVAGPAMGHAVISILESKQIHFNPQLQPTRIDAERKELLFANRDAAPFDFLAATPPHRAPPVVQKSPLANEAGWVPVDRRTLQTGAKNVYAIGDVTLVTLANGKPLPKAGVFADGQAHTVARRIATEIQGAGVLAEYDGLGFCWIETGSGSAGFASGQFYAEPDPLVPLLRSGRMWHWGKILFEKYWLGEGVTRGVSHLGLNLAGKVFGVPVGL